MPLRQGTRSCASDVVGLRSRATGVARLETVAALFVCSRLFCALVDVLWTRDAGRAGAHLPAPAERLGPILSTVHTNDSTLTRNEGLLVSPFLERFLDRSDNIQLCKERITQSRTMGLLEICRPWRSSGWMRRSISSVSHTLTHPLSLRAFWIR